MHDLGWFSNHSVGDVSHATAENTQLNADVREVCSWMGLNRAENSEKTAYEYLLSRFQSQPDLAYSPSERDLIVMRHTFEVDYAHQNSERITSSLVAIGESNGLSAMSSTVGLTSAICARLIMEKRYARPGVQIPLTPDLYNPVLDEMAEFGFAFRESSAMIKLS